MPINLDLTPRQERYRILSAALKALGDETRLGILDALADAPASPVQLAKRAELSLGVVAYHMRVMVGAGLLELKEETRRRGAIEHTYKLTRKGRKLWKDLGLEEVS